MTYNEVLVSSGLTESKLLDYAENSLKSMRYSKPDAVRKKRTHVMRVWGIAYQRGYNQGLAHQKIISEAQEVKDDKV